MSEFIIRALGYLGAWVIVSIIALLDNFYYGVTVDDMSWIDKIICAPSLCIVYPLLWLRRKRGRL